MPPPDDKFDHSAPSYGCPGRLRPVPTREEYTRHCTEIVNQAELLAIDVRSADLRAPVPSCPGWSLGDLVRHIGGGHRWAEEVVRTRATEWLPDHQIRQVCGDDTGELPGDWLVEGATRLAETLRTAGSDTPI